MKIVIAPDKFKGTLSSPQICKVMDMAIRSVIHRSEVVSLPLADGGDGFADAISHYLDARVQFTRVFDPLFRKKDSSWLLAGDGKTAFIEMAKASGLQLLRPSEYDCSVTSTFGTGQLIREAIRQKASEIIIGVGGSATNDGGMGMAAAVGYRFLDDRGHELPPVGQNLIRVARIDASDTKKNNHVRYIVASDVNNLLCGDEGATKVFARQKGATETMIGELEAGMLHFSGVVKKDLGIDLTRVAGAGAAGGLAGGCVAFLGAKIFNGADLMLQYSDAEKYIRQCDVVITGEGKLDQQTIGGKLVARVCALANKYKKRVFVVCGRSELGNSEIQNLGISGIFQLAEYAADESDAIVHANEVLSSMSLVLARSLQ